MNALTRWRWTERPDVDPNIIEGRPMRYLDRIGTSFGDIRSAPGRVGIRERAFFPR